MCSQCVQHTHNDIDLEYIEIERACNFGIAYEKFMHAKKDSPLEEFLTDTIFNKQRTNVLKAAVSFQPGL